MEGYKVTIAHRVEVEVGADGPASAPPSGAAAGRQFQEEIMYRGGRIYSNTGPVASYYFQYLGTKHVSL
jgi:hypothetical protein